MANRCAKLASILTVQIVVGLLATISSPACAENLETPQVKPGDTWTYRDTTEKYPNIWTQAHNEITVDRATSSTIYFSVKQSGSTQPPRQEIMGVDWSRMRDVNGNQTIVNRPLMFPLSVGKSWEVEYKELHPNKLHRSEEWRSRCVAVGNESVEVPEGKFDALKIECEGKWTAELEPAQTVVQGGRTSQAGTTLITSVQRTAAAIVSGRTYKAFWYVPKVKRWVKSVEEYYGSKGLLTERYSSELESYKIAE
jgi:hypothetical protein